MSGADRAQRRRRVTPIVEDGRVRLPLCGRDGSVRAWAIVDEADATWASAFHWSLSKGYAVRGEVGPDGRQRAVLLHRELLGLGPGDPLQGDHINRDPLDNRHANLRVVPRRGNLQNRGSLPGSSSRFRGVHFERWSGRWRAEIKVGGRKMRLGRFASEEEAAGVARAARAREMAYAVD